MSSFTEDFLCGGFGGVAGVISGFFLDTIKVNMQVDPTKGMFATCKTLIKNEGFVWLYKGILFPLLTSPFVSAFTFSSYEFYKNFRGKT